MKHNRVMGWWGVVQWASMLVMLSLAVSIAQAQPKKKAQVVVPGSQPQTAKQVMAQHTDDLRTLMQTLYEQHPEELAKSTQVGAREMTEWVFDGKASWKFEAIRRTQQSDAIALIFDPDYTGDHILALVVGLETLLFNAYGGKNEYEIPAIMDEKPVLQAACQLQSLQKQLDLNVKQIAIVSQTSSRQLIQQALQAIIQRMRGALPDQPNANSSC